MTLQETIRQVKAEICEDRKQIAHTRLESITGVENPHSLMQVFGRGHQDIVIKATPVLVRCNNIAPPRWRLNGQWYCPFPEIRDCAEPGRIPMKPIAIDDIKVMNLGLGRSIYVLRS